MSGVEKTETRKKTRGPGWKCLRPTVRNRLIEAMRVGATYQIACGYAGIHISTLCDALAFGRAGDKRFTEFVAEIEEASSKRAIECLAAIRADESWQSKAWFLERRHQRAFAIRRENLEGDPERAERADGASDLGTDIDLRTAEGRQKAVELLAAMPPAILTAALARHTGVGETK